MDRLKILTRLFIPFFLVGCSHPSRPTEEVAHSWPSDGFIVYISSVDEFDRAPDLWLTSLDGKVRRKLATGCTGVNTPSISPDGKTIVFGGTKNRTSSGLFALNAAGDVTQLTEGAVYDDSPRFHPSGEFLIFERYRDPNVTDIMRLDLASKNITPVVANGSINRYPCISPDGEKISFVSNMSQRFQLYVANVDGTGAKALIEHDDYSSPGFGLNSRELWIGRGSVNDGTREMACLDFNAKVLQRVSLNVDFSSPVILADNTMISELLIDDAWDLYLFNRKGKILRRLSSGEGSEQQATAWQP